uniref:Uncharacterized protein n=1 Tax=Timema tahoe TaxID=61484 RepID=A0A7R9IQ12_9NEOP|nr:unnamed protein product [Timema tahoe]
MSRLGTYKPIMTCLLLAHRGQILYHWELKRRGFSYLRRLFFHFFLPLFIAVLLLTVISSSAAMYSSYVQSGANFCQISLSHGRVKVRGADEGAVDEPGCGSNREKCRLREAMLPRNLRLCNLLLIHFLVDLVLLHERQEGPLSTHFVKIIIHRSTTRCNRSGVDLCLFSLSRAAQEQVQSNLAPRLCHRQRCNRFGATLFLYDPEIFWSSRTVERKWILCVLVTALRLNIDSLRHHKRDTPNPHQKCLSERGNSALKTNTQTLTPGPDEEQMRELPLLQLAVWWRNVVYLFAPQTKMAQEQKCFICDTNILDSALVEYLTRFWLEPGSPHTSHLVMDSGSLGFLEPEDRRLVRGRAI